MKNSRFLSVSQAVHAFVCIKSYNLCIDLSQVVADQVLHHSLLSPPRIWGHHLSIASVISVPVLKCFHFEMNLLNRFITLIMKSFSGVSQNVQKVGANDVQPISKRSSTSFLMHSFLVSPQIASCCGIINALSLSRCDVTIKTFFFRMCRLNMVCQFFLLLNVLSQTLQGDPTSVWTAQLWSYNAFLAMNCFPHTLQIKSPIILMEYVAFCCFMATRLHRLTLLSLLDLNI